MTTPARPEVHAMLIVDCPICDAPSPLDAEAGVLACDACGVTLELTPDGAPALPLAA